MWFLIFSKMLNSRMKANTEDLSSKDFLLIKNGIRKQIKLQPPAICINNAGNFPWAGKSKAVVMTKERIYATLYFLLNLVLRIFVRPHAFKSNRQLISCNISGSYGCFQERNCYLCKKQSVVSDLIHHRVSLLSKKSIM